MAKELYVGHISEQATEEDLRKLFSIMGVVTSVHLIVDEQTGEFKRCGYVRMLSNVDLDEAVETLDGTYLIDRCIVVSIAKPQKDRPAKTPYMKRKPTTSPRPTTERDGSTKERTSSTKTTKSTRPTVKDAGKTGRSSAAKEAARKWRPAVAKDTAKSERSAPTDTRPGRPAGGKRQGSLTRAPAKGRR